MCADKKIALVVAPRGFRDEEYFEPKKILEDAGVSVSTVSKGVSQATGKLSGLTRVDVDLADISTDDFDAIAFIGGPGSAGYYDDDVALDLARSSAASGKPTAAICIAPGILANAGVLSGKKATVWAPPEDESKIAMLEEGGATYTGADVEVDGNIVTANGPHAASAFGKKLLEMLE